MLDPKLTRRGFMKASAFGLGALVLADRAFRSLADELIKLGVPVPWYRRGQIKTTYNYCDICPKWLAELPECDFVVKSN